MLVIKRPIGAGKTTEALRFLHTNGGGIYINTTETKAHIQMLCVRHGFENIDIISVERDTPVVIDDVETVRLVVTKTVRKEEYAGNTHLRSNGTGESRGNEDH